MILTFRHFEAEEFLNISMFRNIKIELGSPKGPKEFVLRGEFKEVNNDD